MSTYSGRGGGSREKIKCSIPRRSASILLNVPCAAQVSFVTAAAADAPPSSWRRLFAAIADRLQGCTEPSNDVDAVAYALDEIAQPPANELLMSHATRIPPAEEPTR
jgi:hypothetical protein